MRARRRAREAALRAMYAHEMSGNPLESVIENMIQSLNEDDKLKRFAVELLRASAEHKDELEKLIVSRAQNWEFDRIAILDKLIMRMAICEFLHFEDIPPKVSIDEAIEISKTYSTEKSGTFINGVLDGVLNQLKGDGLLKKSGRGLNE
ncbi:transcription antitermination factor NusB [candidate division KSB1 bacterium]|nr:transcription antitermination factor NusB [candidate division KSB1 bacterium]TDI84912.1 MAG: transcription antitermination factor NusB [Caldithrix sp.]